MPQARHHGREARRWVDQTRPLRYSLQPRESTLSRSLHSGKNRIVRRIFGSIGFPVKRLVRTQIGPINRRPGVRTYRVLSQAEVRSLSKAVGL